MNLQVVLYQKSLEKNTDKNGIGDEFNRLMKAIEEVFDELDVKNLEKTNPEIEIEINIKITKEDLSFDCEEQSYGILCCLMEKLRDCFKFAKTQVVKDTITLEVESK